MNNGHSVQTFTNNLLTNTNYKNVAVGIMSLT